MTPRISAPAAPSPLEEFAAESDERFATLAQRRSFREYLSGLLMPCPEGHPPQQDAHRARRGRAGHPSTGSTRPTAPVLPVGGDLGPRGGRRATPGVALGPPGDGAPRGWRLDH